MAALSHLHDQQIMKDPISQEEDPNPPVEENPIIPSQEMTPPMTGTEVG